MSDQPATLLSFEEVRPQSFATRPRGSRLEAYRRQQRRKRNRRNALIVTVTLSIVTMGVAFKAHHPEFTFQQFVSKDVVDLSNVDEVLETAAERMQLMAERSKETFHSLKLSFSNANEEASTETDRQRKKGAVVEEDIKPVPDPVEEEIEEQPTSEPEPELEPELTEDIQSQGNDQRQVESRPVLCNVPLSYMVHPKCWRLASKNPVFNLQGLVQDMMQ